MRITKPYNIIHSRYLNYVYTCYMSICNIKKPLQTKRITPIAIYLQRIHTFKHKLITQTFIYNKILILHIM